MRRILLVCFFFLFSFSLICSANEMQVSPSFKFVKWGENINISVSIVPSEPVKAWEFDVFFDAENIQVSSVELGDFFDPYYVWWSDGDIDNVHGSITKIYALTLEENNTAMVDDAGVAFIIHCNTKGIGMSSIVLNDSGLTNNMSYLSLVVKNGAVQVYGEFYPWDLNEDGICNYLDLSGLVSHYGEHIASPGGIPADIREDGKVDYLDVSALVDNYMS